AEGKKLKAGRTYSVQALADGQITLTGPAGKRIGTFSAPLSVTGPGPLTVAGRGSYRGGLEFRPSGSGGGVETINAIGLDDYVRGVVAAEMPSSWATQQPWLRGVPDPYDGAGHDPYHLWVYRLSVATAARKLSGLVKGSLTGVQVTKHAGASPRIVTASVVSTGGRANTTGGALEQR